MSSGFSYLHSHGTVFTRARMVCSPTDDIRTHPYPSVTFLLTRYGGHDRVSCVLNYHDSRWCLTLEYPTVRATTRREWNK